MKIGLVLENFDPQRGGLEQWTWQFAKRLAARHHEVHVIANRCVVPKGDPDLIFHAVEASASPLRQAAAMEATLQSLSLDLIHDMGLGWHADIFHPHGGSSRAFREHNLMRIPRWRQIRFWREKRYREHAAVEDRQLAQPDATVIAVSHMVQDHLIRLHGVPPERVRVIPNGVDTEFFSPESRRKFREAQRQELGCSEGETLFLMVAHNLPLKNAASTLRAFSQIAENHRLAIVGGHRTQRFQRLASSLRLADRVRFCGAVADIRPFYAAADVLVHPTWYDPCSLVVLEALASGLPVITTRFNGVSEMISDSLQGFLLDDPADVPTLAKMMNRLDDPELRAKMGSAARTLGQAHTLDRQTEDILSLYREIIIFRILRQHALHFSGPWTPETSLGPSGANLDSIAILDVILEIESRCGLRLRNETLSADSLSNAGNLIRYLEDLARK